MAYVEWWSTEWLPPFTARAELLAGRWLTTYDGRRYEFATNVTCAYLLTADGRDGNFSVAVRFDGLDLQSKVSDDCDKHY